MTASLGDHEQALTAAVGHALGWLRTVGTRPVAATTDSAGIARPDDAGSAARARR